MRSCTTYAYGLPVTFGLAPVPPPPGPAAGARASARAPLCHMALALWLPEPVAISGSVCSGGASSFATVFPPRVIRL